MTITLIATGFQGGRPVRARQPERGQRAQRPATPDATPRPRTPVLPDDEWAEPAILRFLRERQ